MKEITDEELTAKFKSLRHPTSSFKATEIFETADVDCHIYLIERNGQTFLINTRGGCAFIPKEKTNQPP